MHLPFYSPLKMKNIILILSLIIFTCSVQAQEVETFYLLHPISKNDTVIYKRIVRFDKNNGIYHVRDYFENGQIQMQGTYSSFNKNIKENYWCNYSKNTKQGLYQTWYKNGQLESRSNFIDGKFHGQMEEWYSNGQLSQRSQWIKADVEGNGKGQMNGSYLGWSKDGELVCDMVLEKGLKKNPIDTNYKYLLYTPPEYELDTLKTYPLIIYLHGGSPRGTDLNKLYAYGIPDQTYRGREFPFIIASPQCPLHLRWSTDNWFENFFEEITLKYRVNINKVYLTGVSLGGSGTWYLATKYPDKFAAIAPMSGFTSHIEYLDQNIEKLVDMPIWAFHGKIDKVVQFEETERVIQRLEGKNNNLKFTMPPNVGHGLHWLIYPEQELYDWFLTHDKRTKNKN